MDTCRMEFSGKLLKRGFWLYVWDIKQDKARHLYVGRTGDSSSAHASSPFRRIGQHLDSRLNAKSNALHRRLEEAGVDPETCTFEMTAIGPIFDEQKTREEHKPYRDKAAALERALAEELKRRGYEVLGSHPPPRETDPMLLQQVLSNIADAFPSRKEQSGPRRRFQPVILQGDGPSASELVMQDRSRL